MCKQRSEVVPLGQEMGAVTTGTSVKTTEGGFPQHLQPYRLLFSVCFLDAFFLSSGSSSHLHFSLSECTQSSHTGVSRGLGELAHSKSKNVIMSGFVCAKDKSLFVVYVLV